MDSDEEEMRALRASERHSGRRPAPTARNAENQLASDEVGPSASLQQPSSSSTARRRVGLVSAAAASDEEAITGDEGDALEEEEVLPEMKGLFPVSFGKQKTTREVGFKVHNAQRRKDTLAEAHAVKHTAAQIGRRRTDAATAAGAEIRAARKAAASQNRPSENEPDHIGGEEQAPRQAASSDMAVDESEEPDELPEPGREAEMLPVTHEVIIPAHVKAVTAMGLDPAGARMVTGGVDGNISFFDFNGMSESKQSFRTLDPVEGHRVQAISFGTTGSMLLVCCSDWSARIYDRDGSSKPIQTTVKGDMYVRDMQHTKGHTQMLTDGTWHPLHAENWLTASLDGTLRLWDINATPVGMDQQLPSLHVLKTLDKRNVCIGGGSGRAGGLHPCSCAVSLVDGKHIVGGCSDGSVQVFFEKARYQRPDRILRKAHSAAVTGVAFMGDGSRRHMMVTRSLDKSMKVWDCRMLSDEKGPIKTFDDLATFHEKSGVCSSPDGRYIVTGTSSEKVALGDATVRVYDTTDFRLVRTLDFGKRPGIRFAWPRELNQLIVGTSSGEVVMLYSPFSSKKGAMHFVGRKAKLKSAIMESESMGPVFCMTDRHDIEKFYTTGHGNMARIRKHEARMSQKTKTPTRPNFVDPGRDAADFQAAVLKNGGIRLNSNTREQDSQKALLSYADKAEKDSKFVLNAYKSTQPEKILDYTIEVSEGDRRMSEMAGGDFCRKCGMKLCRCVDYSIYGENGNKRQRTL